MTRTENLATAFEQATNRIATVAEGLSDTAWNATPAGEARTAGQIAYHMAEVYTTVSGLIQLAVAGQPLPALTAEIIDGINAEEATRCASVGREGVLKMLRRNGITIGAMLRTLSDAQLDTSTVFFGYSMTVEDLARNALVGHTEEHLRSIQDAAISV